MTRLFNGKGKTIFCTQSLEDYADSSLQYYSLLRFPLKTIIIYQVVVVHIPDFSRQMQADLCESEQAWFTEQVPGQPGQVHRETLS